jgi:hypothetical protein
VSVPVSSRALTGAKNSPPGIGLCCVKTGAHDDLCHGGGVSIEYPSTLAYRPAAGDVTGEPLAPGDAVAMADADADADATEVGVADELGLGLAVTWPSSRRAKLAMSAIASTAPSAPA